MMLPGQGGIDAAIEKYGFRVIGLLQELQRRERKLGSQHTDTADVLYNLGRLYQQHGDFKEALGAFNRALKVSLRLLAQALIVTWVCSIGSSFVVSRVCIPYQHS